MKTLINYEIFGVYTLLQFLAAISYTVGNVKEDDNSSEISDNQILAMRLQQII